MVIYISSGRLFKTLQDEQFNRMEEEEYSSFYDDILNVDLPCNRRFGYGVLPQALSARRF